jgi:hypothetical protein
MPNLTRRFAPVLFVVLVLAVVYVATLQTQISGSFKEDSPANILKNEYIKDVSEIQVALNTWGTIHHTGYPLYAILGNLFTVPFRAIGIGPAAAASLVATTWGVVMLACFGRLIGRLIGRPWLAAGGVILLGVTRSIWVHQVIAEVYSMSLAITALLLLIALWPGTWSAERRFLWMALIGGIGVAHHRAVAFVAPGLLLAIWPHLRAAGGPSRGLLIKALGLVLIGFLPYIYLPLREHQGGDWVYGEPGTLRGFWIEFSGKEANRLVQPPADAAALWHNLTDTWTILARELTLPGLLLSLIALGTALTVSPHCRAARIVSLCAAGPLIFTLYYHTAVLPQAILLPVLLALVFGVALAADWLIAYFTPPPPKKSPRRKPAGPPPQPARRLPAALMAGLLLWAGGLIGWNYGYIHALVTEPTGQQTIERLKTLPRDQKIAVMLPWGPRYAAASYSRLVTGENDDLLTVDHKANYPQLIADGYQIWTEPDTFYTYPPPWPSAYGAPSNWWIDHLGTISLTSAAPGFVRLLNTPWLADPDSPPGMPVIYGIERRAAWLSCDARQIYLHVVWSADSVPTVDPSIFVHLTGDDPGPNPINADSRYPVYGLYPFTRWSPGELVRDDFTLPRLPDKTVVRFGLYEQDASGQFVNYGEKVLPVAGCEPE